VSDLLLRTSPAATAGNAEPNACIEIRHFTSHSALLRLFGRVLERKVMAFTHGDKAKRRLALINCSADQNSFNILRRNRRHLDLLKKMIVSVGESFDPTTKDSVQNHFKHQIQEFRQYFHARKKYLKFN
jgi:hypothetical protein